MNKPFIVIVRKNVPFDRNFDLLIKHGQYGCKYDNEFKILKIVPRLCVKDTGGIASIDLKLQYSADFVYDTNDGVFLKNRTGKNGINSDLDSLTPTLQRVMRPVSDIIHDSENKDNLYDRYDRKDLLEAIFLTNTFNELLDYDDILVYQLIRYKYGKHISECYMKELIEKYPEKLI